MKEEQFHVLFQISERERGMEFPWGQVTLVQRDDGTWWETEGARGRQDGTRARDWGGSGWDEIKPYGKKQKSISDSQIPLHAFWLLFLIWSETSPDLTRLPVSQCNKSKPRAGRVPGWASLGKWGGSKSGNELVVSPQPWAAICLQDKGAGWAQFIMMARQPPEAQSGTVRRVEPHRHKQPSARVLTSAFLWARGVLCFVD